MTTFNKGWCNEFELPRTEFLLHTVKDIEEKLILWCQQNKYSQGDSYNVGISKSGRWIVGYSNDYPMQHGDGKSFTLTEEEFRSAMKIITKQEDDEKLLEYLLSELHLFGFSFEKVLLPETYGVKRIRVARFTDKYYEDSKELWNDYVARVFASVGAKDYCKWVKNQNGDIVGTIVMNDAKGDEIKSKHFHEWGLLLKAIEEEYKTSLSLLNGK